MSQSGTVEVADVFRQYGLSYRQSHKMPLNHLRAMRAIEICRTRELGGHVDECDTCGSIRISYNSCRNRHCPKCQFTRKEKWLEARKQDLLPIQYFHIVFTIPDELNPLALRNQRVIYNILLKSVSETLIQLGKDSKHLGANIGFISILHTWGQNLMDHPHIHCIVTGGGLSFDGKRWLSCKKGFFLSVRVMSRLFRGKFLYHLQRSYQSEELLFSGDIVNMKDPVQFKAFLKALYQRQWVVYCKPPFKGPDMVLQYLARYTHRIAISNHRIIAIEDDRVSFRWRDYSDGNKSKIMTLYAFEFIRRFLLHVLPDRFVKIRYYGLLCSRNRKANLILCRELLGGCINKTKDKDTPETWQELLLRISGIDLMKCPFCEKGRMHTTEILKPLRCNGPP